jgi:polyhydroxybutyrate depolymerase
MIAIVSRSAMSILAVLGLLVATMTSAHAAEDARQILKVKGSERSYLVRAAHLSTAPTERVPLVLVLHGGGGNAAIAENMSGFTAKAKKEGFIVAYPEGSGRFAGKLLTWNAGHCCGYAMKRSIDDVAFISALIERLIADYPVDPQRVYVTGMSNGGLMSHRLGIELSHKLAAIAPVVATLFGDEPQPRSPVPALMLNGMLDKAVPHLGGPPGGRVADAWDGTPTKPALAQARFWAKANGCAATPTQLDHGRYLLWRYVCAPSSAVELYLLKDNGHAWPGGQPGSRRGDTPSSALNATDVIWQFFQAQVRR